MGTVEPYAASKLFRVMSDCRDAGPDAIAVRTATIGGWNEATRHHLYSGALAAATAAREFAGSAPVVVRVDGSIESIETVVGLALAGTDMLLIEDQSSHLADPGSAIHRIGSEIVVGPPAEGATSFGSYKYMEHRNFRSYGRFSGPDRDGEVLQMTSGSTGESRIVRQPFRNALLGASTYRQIFGFTARDTLLVSVPLAHSFGFIGGMLAALVSGARLWTLPRFDLRTLLCALDNRATVLLGTPLVYDILSSAMATRNPPAALRAALTSGGPLASRTAAAAKRALGIAVRQIYGSTETGLIAAQPELERTWPADATGVAAPGIRVRVEPPTMEGQLWVRTPTLFIGYAGEENGVELTPDGFYPTGDVARIDAEGRIFLIGRKGTFVNVGGRKVNPHRIERILSEHTAVREVYVHGVTPDGREEHIEAVVVLERPGTITDLARFCRMRGLLPYEVPHSFRELDRLPRGALGKVDRQRILEDLSGRSTSETTPTESTAPAVRVPATGNRAFR